MANKDWYITWDKRNEKFIAVENSWKRATTPVSISGNKVVGFGRFRNEVAAIDYAKSLLAAGRLKV